MTLKIERRKNHTIPIDFDSANGLFMFSLAIVSTFTVECHCNGFKSFTAQNISALHFYSCVQKPKDENPL